jgi:peptidyl-prolyl cis-trans isomerase A (cyclophilin A)
MRSLKSLLRRTLRQSSTQPRRVRLEVERLETRAVPANASGTITGLAFIDSTPNGVHDAGEDLVSGITFHLSGTTTTGAPVGTDAITDINGSYSFTNVLPGSYTVSLLNVPAVLPVGATSQAVTIAGGDTQELDFAFRGLSTDVVSLRLVLTNTPEGSLPFATPGFGQSPVNPRANNAPIVSAAIGDVNVAADASPTTIDLAGNFDDPDISNSTVRLDTSGGPINISLFDKAAPRTVANYINYIQSGRYDSTIFHRLMTDFVLQGGGFKFSATPASSLTPVTADPAVQNEFGASNTTDTIAMAKLPGDPNSATDEFFFNLANNNTGTNNLDTQNGGFTVFGKVASAADQAVLNDLATTPTQDFSHGDVNSPFQSVPLNNYTGSNFPTDTTAANFLLVKDAVVVSRPEALTYSVVANNNRALVAATIVNNRLTLTYTAGQTGTASITVRATDQFGAFVDATFNVKVG